MAGHVAEGHVVQLQGTRLARQIDCAGLVAHVDGHVEYFENALTRRHRPLHDAVLNGEGAYRVEEALHVEEKGHHHPELELLSQHHASTDHDHDGHRDAGERVDDGDHDVGELRRAQVCDQVVVRLVVEEREVDPFASHLLDGANSVDVLRERAVHDRARLSRPQESPLGVGQPDDAHHEQHRHHREGEQAELEIEHQQHRNDADEEDEIADREDGGFQELLQRVHVSLQPRHEPAHFGLVHEGEGDVLQVQVHRSAQVEEKAPEMRPTTNSWTKFDA